MSKTHLVCFADSKMTISQKLLVNSAWEHGIHNAVACSPESISDEFKDINRDIFKYERGCGYWLWKPWIIYKTMLCDFVNEDDIIFYSDSGTTVINNLNYIIDRMRENNEEIFLFSGRFKQIEWCKMDVINAINHKSLSITPTSSGDIISMYGYQELPQVQASQMFFIVNDRTRKFVKEWLSYCIMPGMIDDSPSKIPNASSFSEHRHDQAILCALQIKYSIPIHWWPGSMNMDRQQDFRDEYPALFNHHRKRNNEF